MVRLRLSVRWSHPAAPRLRDDPTVTTNSSHREGPSPTPLSCAHDVRLHLHRRATRAERDSGPDRQGSLCADGARVGRELHLLPEGGEEIPRRPRVHGDLPSRRVRRGRRRPHRRVDRDRRDRKGVPARRVLRVRGEHGPGAGDRSLRDRRAEGQVPPAGHRGRKGDGRRHLRAGCGIRRNRHDDHRPPRR